MPTEYCNVCGCVVPYCKHTGVHAGMHEEMAQAAARPVRKKGEYKMQDPQIIPATTLWPQRPDLQGKFVAKGYVVFPQDADEELAFHTEHLTRTSLLVKIDIEAGYIETLNSIYWIV